MMETALQIPPSVNLPQKLTNHITLITRPVSSIAHPATGSLIAGMQAPPPPKPLQTTGNGYLSRVTNSPLGVAVSTLLHRVTYNLPKVQSVLTVKGPMMAKNVAGQPVAVHPVTKKPLAGQVPIATHVVKTSPPGLKIATVIPTLAKPLHPTISYKAKPAAASTMNHNLWIAIFAAIGIGAAWFYWEGQ